MASTEAVKNNLVAHGINLPYRGQQHEGWPAGSGDVSLARAQERPPAEA